ncbi:MAG: hypothetical protein AAF390_12405 [Pseudomonadota bacterium]
MRSPLGFLITAIIFAIGYSIIFFPDEVLTRTGLAPNEFGDFLAGIFAPIALTWLIIGYFQQAAELRENSRALRDQVSESAKQNHALSQQLRVIERQLSVNERNAFIGSYEIRYNELVFMCSDILRAFSGKEKFKENLDLFSAGYRDVFPNLLKNTVFEMGPSQFATQMDGFFDDGNRMMLAYCHRFERFSADADVADPSGQLRRVIESSEIASAYVALCRVFDREPDLVHRRGGPAEGMATDDGWRRSSVA